MSCAYEFFLFIHVYITHPISYISSCHTIDWNCRYILYIQVHYYFLRFFLSKCCRWMTIEMVIRMVFLWTIRIRTDICRNLMRRFLCIWRARDRERERKSERAIDRTRGLFIKNVFVIALYAEQHTSSGFRLYGMLMCGIYYFECIAATVLYPK